MAILKRLGKWFGVSGLIGVLVGLAVVGLLEAIIHLRINAGSFSLLLMLLAPGTIAGLGMPPMWYLLLVVCGVNFLLYGLAGLLLALLGSLFRTIDRPLSAPASPEAARLPLLFALLVLFFGFS